MDYDGLVNVMGHLVAIKDRLATTDVMFEPLKHTIELLLTYGQEMSDEIHQSLEVRHALLSSSHTFHSTSQELPEKWNNIKKQSAVMKQAVAPLQAEEVNRIRRELSSFDVKQHEFREEFRKTAPFNYNMTHPYIRIDRVRG